MIKNAKSLPQVYFGLHMVEGVAEYREPGQEAYRIFIGESAIKNMDPTFAGRPVYVRHVEEVDLENLQAEADGYVTKSFYNKSDGKHWVEFLVVSDHGHEAIRNGWKLSNAYIPKEMGSGGLWHGVEYVKEVKRGEYEHLAIVPNPRYEESVIYTPEQFKEYCEKKEAELKRLANSKKGEFSMLNLFRKTKVENAAEFEGIAIVLPKSKKERTFAQLVNDADDMAMMDMDNVMANGDHHVMVGEEKMKVNDLIKKHMDMCNEMMKMKQEKGGEPGADDEEAKKKALELAAHEEKEIAEKKANEEKSEAEKKAADEKKANEEKALEEEKMKNALYFDTLKNADKTPIKEIAPVEISEDRVKRGQQRYGSN